MPKSAQIAAQATAWNGANLACMARVQDIAGTDITVAAVESITCEVVQVDKTSTKTSPDVTVDTNTVFDTLQTQLLDPTWPFPAPDAGYNFKFELIPADIPLANKQYQAQFTFTDKSTPPNISKVAFKIDTGNWL